MAKASPANIRQVDATPHAAALIEGHRDFGYSLETALADIVDNSITAGARNVWILADTAADEPSLSLVDDGCGMTEAELVEAMRLGSKNPTDRREAKDLGRFGLGLKSASFSQCRELVVLTCNNGKVSCARWNMNRVAKRDDWMLELLDDTDEMVEEYNLSSSGTVVIWKNLDRLCAGYTQKDKKKRSNHLNAEIARSERHLRLVFHRFLEGSKPRLNIYLNERPISPIDPMASQHTATQKDPKYELMLRRRKVMIQCHTLPHHRKMTQEEYEDLGGPDGHLKSQGLYVYRENRLIIAGGWLGLARQEELTKLCRISVEIPNSMDAEWKIDVKKASAQLPPLVREHLKRTIERFVGTSKRTYRSKGRKLVDSNYFPFWNRVKNDNQIMFEPNFEHPVFRSYAEKLPTHLKDGFERCLRLVGSGLPIETLHAELTGNAEAVVPAAASELDLEEVVYTMAKELSDGGMDRDSLLDTMKRYPFLRERWDAVGGMVQRIVEGEQL